MLQYYYDLASQPSRALYMFLELTKIPYERKVVALRSGEHRTEEYAEKVNPLKKVPVIIDDGFRLTESVAIFRYLCDKYRVPEHWYPHGLEKRARVEEFMNWQHMNVRFNTATVFIKTFIEPTVMGKTVEKKQLARFVKKMEESLDHMENVWLKGQDYVAGDEISVADLLAFCELTQVLAGDIDVNHPSRPRLQAWMNRVKQHVATVYDEAHEPIMLMRQLHLSRQQSKL